MVGIGHSWSAAIHRRFRQRPRIPAGATGVDRIRHQSGDESPHSKTACEKRYAGGNVGVGRVFAPFAGTL